MNWGIVSGTSVDLFFYLSTPGKPDLILLLHAAHQSFGEWAELRCLHTPSHAGTHEQPIDGHLGHNLNG